MKSYKSDRTRKKVQKFFTREEIQKRIASFAKAKRSFKNKFEDNWFLLDVENNKFIGYRKANKKYPKLIPKNFKLHPIVGNLKRYKTFWIPEFKAELARKDLEKISAKGPFEIISFDVTFFILSHLNIIDIMNMCRTSKAWNELCKNDTLWLVLLNRDFPWYEGSERPSTLSKKEQYIHNIFNVRFNIIFLIKIDIEVDIFSASVYKNATENLFFQQLTEILKSNRYSVEGRKELQTYFDMKIKTDKTKVNYIFGISDKNIPYVTVVLRKVPVHGKHILYNHFASMKNIIISLNHIKHIIMYEPFQIITPIMPMTADVINYN